MLIEFSVKNFMSFEDEATLSMRAMDDDEIIEPLRNEDNVMIFTLESGEKIRLLKSVAIYGANASGKSNFLTAIHAFRVLCNSFVGAYFDKQTFAFKFKEKEDTKTYFKAKFLHQTSTQNGEKIYSIYSYSITSQGIKIFTEELKKSEELVFKKDFDTKKERFDFDYPTNESYAEKYAEEIQSKDYTFLSYAGHRMEDSVLKPFFVSLNQFFFGVKHGRGPLASRLSDWGVQRSDNKKKELLDFLDSSGISHWEDITIHEHPSKVDDGRLIAHQSASITAKSSSGKSAEIDFEEESTGTQVLVAFFLAFNEASSTDRETLLITHDEFEASLHPKLSISLLGYFHKNSNYSQLIFTTHSSHFLSAEYDALRPDQIYFVRKDSKRLSSTLERMEVFRVSEKTDMELAYIRGEYGAIPSIG